MPSMTDQPTLRLVDSRQSASVSFAPPDPVTLGPRGRTPTRAPIAVGPGRAVTAGPNRVRAEPRGGVTYPIQPGKIQAPALRDETLARTRLLDWLDVKIHSRVVFVIADSGYGKTTLLADFSRRTRLRTIWYRLDEEDRDWVGFLAHLVAAGREFDAEFAPRTAAILRSLEPGGPTREDAIETFLEELPTIAADGAALILDDFHVADESPDIRQIAREIVVRGPERLSVVFASRRAPSVPVAKLRTLGELAELGISDLRFSDSEMEQLFRETYRRPLDPDVLSDLAKRTEGWAASLTLVQAALRERTPAETRSFVRGLSGARDELHDYLAEEVVGDLPVVQQQFLMRTSILQRVTPELAQVATGLGATEVQSMVTEAERLGLLGRRPRRRSAEQRYHPLVREFLEDRLRREVGSTGVDELHVTVARWAEPTDWRTAAHHYSAALRRAELQGVLERHLETIVASGAFSVAAEFARILAEGTRSAALEVIASRQASVEGDVAAVEAHASAAAALEPDNDVVVLNLIASRILSGELAQALPMAEHFARTGSTQLMREVAFATTILIKASLDFHLGEASAVFEALAIRSARDQLTHFEGVSLLNAALADRVQGKFDLAFERVLRSADLLSASSSGSELGSALFLKATLTGYRGDLASARKAFADAGRSTRHSSRTEFLTELAELELLIGDVETAAQLLTEVDERSPHSMGHMLPVLRAGIALRRRAYAEAFAIVSQIDASQPAATVGQASRVLSLRASSVALLRDSTAPAVANEAAKFAERQGAGLWHSVSSLALGVSSGRLDAAILNLPAHLHCAISFGAELIVDNIDQLGDDAKRIVVEEALIRPERWLPAIRLALASLTPDTRSRALRLLADVGDSSDVKLLSVVGRTSKASPEEKRLGRQLARRLAPRVSVEDLGRTEIRIGQTVLGGHEVRRKVLALLCFLLTRPRFSATREEVTEALWPDIDPAAAVNSLNQSVYFLRRVFEREYSEDTSAGYVQQDADLLWLDVALVKSRSGACVALVGQFDRQPSAEVAEALCAAYVGRFAIEFSYDEWTVDFRDWLHISYLRVVERQVREYLDASRFEEGLAMARRALEVDPRNDHLELSVLRLLRSSGAHSAAAEQYSHYAALLKRDLDIEAPPESAL